MRLILVSGSCYGPINEKNNFISCLANRFQAKGYEVSIVFPTESLHLMQQKVKGVMLFGLPSIPFFYHSKTLVPIPLLLNFHVKALLAKLKPDIIHIQDHLALSSAFVQLNKEFDVPIIGTNHLQPNKFGLIKSNNNWNKFNDHLKWKRFSKVFNQLETVTALTGKNAALMRTQLIPKVITIPNGVDLYEMCTFIYNEKNKKKFGVPKRPILFFESIIDADDRLKDIINGVAIAIKSVDFSFVVIGNGIVSQLIMQLIEKLGLNDYVYFFNELSREDISSFYGIGGCFIAAGLSIMHRNAVMNAMAHGLPIITVDDVVWNDLVHDGINGYMYSRGDVEAIANYIHVILSVKYVYSEMSRKSLEYIQFYDLDKTVDLFEELYRKNHWLHSVLQQI